MSNSDDTAIGRLAAALRHPTTRRRFLQLLGATTAAACGGDGASAPTDAGVDATDTGLDAADVLDALDAADALDAVDTIDAADACCDTDWFGAMERLRDAFRASPDHLEERSRALIAAADPEAMLSFVRDEILLVPTDDDALTRFELNWMHWGPDAALRCGRGTQRTRAELLARMYREAGFEADIYTGIVALSQDELRRLMLGEPSEASPAVDEDELRAIAQALGASTDGNRSITFPSQNDADALAERILATLATDAPDLASWLGDGFEGDLCLVGVTVDGELRWANPNHPTATFGDSGVSTTPRLAEYEADSDEVEVRLEWARAATPDQTEVLVAETWRAHDVAGRRLSAVLQPFGNYSHFATADARSQREFVPMLAFEQREGDEGPASKRGDVVTLDGRTMVIDEDAETITIDGAPIVRGEGTAAAAAVRTLEARASATAFPDVNVRLTALDAGGGAVAGLDAGVLEVRDEGQAVPFLLTSNSPARPRVLFIVDRSGSVAEPFLGNNLSPRLRAMMDAIVAARPDAEFAIELISFGINATPTWTRDIDDIIAAHDNSFADGSEIWSAAATAQSTGATVAVLITDAEASDEPDDALRAGIAGGVPLVCVHAADDDTNRSVMDEIAALSGGTVVDIDDPDAVVDRVVQALDVGLTAFYELTYPSLASAAGERTVRVEVVGGPQAETSYVAPAGLVGVNPNAPIGLYYVLRVGPREVRRTLAGWTPVGFESPDDADLPGYADDVRDNAMSGVTLTFDAGAPTRARMLDDELTARVSMRGFGDFVAGGADSLSLQPAFLDTTTPPVPAAVDVLGGMPSRIGDVPIYPLGLGVVATGAHAVRLDDERARRTGWVDLLPVTRYGAYASSARASFEHTARATAMQALWEASTFENSTVTALAGSSLFALSPFGGVSDLGVELTDEQLRTFRRMLVDLVGEIPIVDASGAPVGAWIIDPATGAIIGRLPSARGGAETVAELTYLKNVLGWAGWLGGVTGALNATHGALIALVVFHIKMWTIADAVVGSLTPVSDDRVDREIAGLLCDIVRAFGASALGPAGGAIDGIWGLVENIVGTSLCEAITME